MPLSSIFLISNSNASWPIADASGDDVPSVQRHALASSCVGPYAATYAAQNLHNFLECIVLFSVLYPFKTTFILTQHCNYVLIVIFLAFGDVFAGIGVREPQPRASEAFTRFGETHRNMEKLGIKFLKTVKPMLTDLGTYLNKAVPDTKLTIKKYADVKFEYLSYCLKVKEMDDEEYTYQALQEPLYRVETGNYEYRLILRCRQDARARFSKLRSDVLVKLELLDQKHVQDIVFQMNRLLSALSQYNENCYRLMQETNVFPIELDLPQTTFQYSDTTLTPTYHDDDEEEEEEDCEVLVIGEEALQENKSDDDLLQDFLGGETMSKELMSLNLLDE
ncbi:PRKCA-binding protein-like [Stegodyphus dumicola]|uniref:PRKCA-binding protein-like n=1 Tax=Stegodyphus dumicola TaxID=202533 RepID=UPI0015A88329|nr:PRKCA-binding protein-like [Stegodyphus dumicola]